MEYDLSVIKERLNFLKGKKSFRQFAEELIISEDSLKGYICRGKIPRLDTLNVICKKCKCDMGFLLGEYDTLTKEASDICEVTGLSEEAVQTLIELKSIASKPVSTEYEHLFYDSIFLSARRVFPLRNEEKFNAQLLLDFSNWLIACIEDLQDDILNMPSDMSNVNWSKFPKYNDIKKTLQEKHFIDPVDYFKTSNVTLNPFDLDIYSVDEQGVYQELLNIEKNNTDFSKSYNEFLITRKFIEILQTFRHSLGYDDFTNSWLYTQLLDEIDRVNSQKDEVKEKE